MAKMDGAVDNVARSEQELVTRAPQAPHADALKRQEN
jgi:hypothetical protein